MIVKISLPYLTYLTKYCNMYLMTNTHLSEIRRLANIALFASITSVLVLVVQVAIQFSMLHAASRTANAVEVALLEGDLDGVIPAGEQRAPIVDKTKLAPTQEERIHQARTRE